MTSPAADPRDRLIVALDFPHASAAHTLLRQLGDDCRWVKVGLELFIAEGTPLVHQLRSLGYHVFLDLKLHDIPNTVAGAVRTAARAGASLLTLHAAGGPAMMEAAADAAAGTPDTPKLLAVTVLTSIDAAQLHATGVPDSPTKQVSRLAHLAWASGLRGLVCSAEEVAALRAEFGYEANLVVPGIRPAGSAKGDQTRVATPAEAIERGASRIVVGRPITEAVDPRAAVAAVLAELAKH